MATFDMTLKTTPGVGANSIAQHTNVGNPVRTIERILDIDAMIVAGATIADGDIFQLLEIPAQSIILFAGAEILKPFTASCTCNIDFAAGDDIIDGGDLTQAAGTYLVKGTNGETNLVNTGAASTFAAENLALVGTADTIDVTIAGAAATTGKLRLYACVADISAAMTPSALADRDYLA
ncbi:MAG: hypothetical protein CMF96_07265 [Candidatus Marinimicrobia bacterium]|nr:hypothetical protein [Candidatus Neomarinimicrobiota bacterium]MAJ44528.1 hypothetical protein [Candidatus Neomarinimicrobiota bacterium]|tara:strand:- start:1751 stop:2287 length:537 start_codon:yes stop_codon:yes gene_type:complete